MATDLYTTRTLVKVLEGLDVPQPFLLDMFFPELRLFETERIDFDVLDRAEGIAPFVHPLVKGTTQKTKGYTTNSFTPAYLKPKHRVDPGKPLKRMAGESFGGDMSNEARRNAHIAQILAEHRRAVLRRKELMAAEVLRTGAITVVGEDYPSVSISFGRDASLSKALTTTARWTEASGVSPIADIQTWADEVADLSGARPTEVVLEPKAWAQLRADQDFKDGLDNRRQSGGEAQFGPVARGSGRYGIYVGSFGEFNFYVYQQPYTDTAGAALKILPDYAVIMSSPELEGVQAHGAILDPRAGYQAFEIFPKNWIEEDPAGEFVMSQSAPLLVPSRPNASLYVKVSDLS